MKPIRRWFGLIGFLCVVWPGALAPQARELFQTSALPEMPVALTGVFAGTSGGVLIVAGGTSEALVRVNSSPDKWNRSVYTLVPGEELWRSDLKLERPVAFGGSVTVQDDPETPDNESGIICVGGMDATRTYADVFHLQWIDGRVTRTPLPPLPAPRACAGVALLDETIYVVCGREADFPALNPPKSDLWALDLSQEAQAWQVLEPFPGAPRVGPMATARDGALYVAGGYSPRQEASGFADAYRYRPGEGWKRIADMPRSVAFAPAAPYGQSHLFVFGGIDGNTASTPRAGSAKNSDFSNPILAYHTITDTWTEMGTVPGTLAGNPIVTWENREGASILVSLGGEDSKGSLLANVSAYQAEPLRSHFQVLDYVALLAYLASLVAMGFYFSRRRKGTDDFFLAGRRIPWWAAGISIFGTQLSSITFMAIPAKVYATDWVYFLSVSGIILVAPIVIRYYLPFFRRLNVTSAYEYLEVRFNLAVRLFGSASFVLFQLGRMAIVLLLPSIALTAVTGIDVRVCIVVMGVMATFYTVVGGIEAVIWTDVLQVFVLVGGGILSVLTIVFSVDGGLSGIVATGLADGKFHAVNLNWDIATASIWVVLVGNLFINLAPYTSDQAVVQRYLTTKTEQLAAKSIWTNAALIIPVSLLWYFLGTCLYVFYKAHPEQLAPSLPTDAVFPLFIAQELPMGLSGLVIAGLFAATMSTLDSSLNSVAAVIVTDFYRRFRPSAEDGFCLKLASGLTILLGVFATMASIVMAGPDIKSLWDTFNAFVGLLLGGLAGLFVLGIFTRRSHGYGALVGAAASSVALYQVQKYQATHIFLYAAIGILTCVAVGYVASLLLPSKPRSLDGLTVYTLEKR